MPTHHPEDDPRIPEEFRLIRRLFREVERVAPGHSSGGMTGFSLNVPPAEALAALQALPDGAGMEAVLRAMGHTPDE